MFLNEVTLQKKIEDIVNQKKVSYLDAMLIFCEENMVDIEDIASLVSSNLKEKIRLDAQEEGLMKRTSKLPI